MMVPVIFVTSPGIQIEVEKSLACPRWFCGVALLSLLLLVLNTRSEIWKKSIHA